MLTVDTVGKGDGEIISLTKPLGLVVSHSVSSVKPNVSFSGVQDVFKQSASIVNNEAEDLLIKATTILKDWGTWKGINLRYLPEIAEKPLSKINIGGFVASENKIFLNNRFTKPYLLEEVISHEGFHAYCANLRSAWAYQFPDQADTFLKEVFTDLTFQGESQSILSDSLGSRIKPPTFTPQEREHVAQYLKTLFDNLDQFVLYNKEDQIVLLTPDAQKKISAELVPHLKTYFSQFLKPSESSDIVNQRGLDKLTNYLRSQIFRFHYVKNKGIIPPDKCLASIQDPLTEDEVTFAKKAFKEYIHTIERTNDLRKGKNSGISDRSIEQEILGYSLGNWEERNARKIAVEYQLHLAKTGRLEFRSLDLFENDFRLLDLAEQFSATEHQLALCPQNITMYQNLQKLKTDQNNLWDEVSQLTNKIKTLVGEEKHATFHYDGSGKITGVTYRKRTPEEKELEKTKNELMDTINQLDKEIEALEASIEIFEKTPEREVLLQKRQKILNDIKEIAPKGTLNPLPSFFFESPEIARMYHRNMPH